ncbi:paraquat-inducible protein A [Kangiella sp. TOML190]|uniref:paraquat-inducible protein A n=1 Tax=Kangiella sp. TOML190 TaxID=2931351 RepID=UPI00203AF30C|nr:paraquat-inducible protein A [Kangiella sp. TOML190]
MDKSFNKRPEYPSDSAAHYGLAACHDCGKLDAVEKGHCSRCGSHLHLRTPNSVQTTIALLITSILLYIPANTFPIMVTNVVGDKTYSTIIGGVIIFLQLKSYFVASVIFIASVFIPIAKIAALFWLCYNVSKKEKLKYQELTKMYRVTEFIGKWSMIDVFVVALMVALVQVGNLMTIHAGIAAFLFAGVVMVTMVAAHSFDTRLIWDKLE